MKLFSKIKESWLKWQNRDMGISDVPDAPDDSTVGKDLFDPLVTEKPGKPKKGA